ncbi:hypothetical protein MVEN_01672800 [Mycena venus]|uniref:VIT domain-containing protein n=1 Tax=Mycena venus TaxID=2733690 RepID=A0A8H6XQ46_9AGAR|nr:hypothetical protein MVEN_01672800 [Mycena venus]
MSRNPWGLWYSVDNRIISLPLLHVKAVATLKELAAQVNITQTYINDADSPLEAIYSFPIPARAAVCSFVMIKQDETRVIGHVQEKGEAREIYESAVGQGRQAALMEQQTPDVFRISVGNIQPQEKVQIELIYATELAEDEENDSIRFHLPVHIGARYGQPPDATVEQTGSAFLEIFVDVEAVAPIAKIGCLSHTVSTELGPNPALLNAKELPFSNYARVSLSSESALDKDFVLTVKSAGLDAPRCVAELHPIHNTTGLILTLVPRFKLPDLARQEFVFLVDRSGSMKGPRVAAAKKALVVMLRSLPAKGTFFQIASFGSNTTLEDATQHVDGMQADYGGTKIREALAHCFAARQTDRPTSVFVLTDGAAWDIDGVLAEVKTAVANCAAQAYLRVSVLGIGNSASTAMCEGIARVGNGTCMMVGEQETSFTGKIARMLKAARTPLITDIAVDWGVSAVEEDEDDAFVIISDDERDEDETKGKGKGKEKEKNTLSIFDETVDPMQVLTEPPPPPPAVVLSPPPQVQQSPFKIRTLNPGNRLNVYAILQGKAVPKAVTLTGLTKDESELKLSLSTRLQRVKSSKISKTDNMLLLPPPPDDADLLVRTVKASIVRLAKMYSISSSQTSFVVVDESATQVDSQQVFSVPEGRGVQRHSKRMLVPPIRRQAFLMTSALGPRTRSRRSVAVAADLSPADVAVLTEDSTRDPNAPLSSTTWSRLTKANKSMDKLRGVGLASHPVNLQPGGGRNTRPPPLPVAHSTPSEKDWIAPESWTAASVAGVDVDGVDDDKQDLSPAILSKLRTRPSSSSARGTGTGGLKRKSMNEDAEADKIRMLETRMALFEQGSTAAAVTQTGNKHSSLHTESPMDPLEALARLQSFDGCFALRVLSTVQLNVEPEHSRAVLGVSEEVFATIIAMAFLCTKLGPEVERESWEAMYDKARAYVEDALQAVGSTVGVDELQAQAVSYLA